MNQVQLFENLRTTVFNLKNRHDNRQGFGANLIPAQHLNLDKTNG